MTVDVEMFVRDGVRKPFEAALEEIATEVLAQGIDYMEDVSSILDIVVAKIKKDDLVLEEVIYCWEMVMTQCSLLGLVQKGLLSRDGELYGLTDLGREAYDRL